MYRLLSWKRMHGALDPKSSDPDPTLIVLEILIYNTFLHLQYGRYNIFKQKFLREKVSICIKHKKWGGSRDRLLVGIGSEITL